MQESKYLLIYRHALDAGGPLSRKVLMGKTPTDALKVAQDFISNLSKELRIVILVSLDDIS